MVLSPFSIWEQPENSYLGQKPPKDIQLHELQSKNAPLRCAVHANDVESPFYFNNPQVRRVNNYQVLDNSCRLNAQKFPQDSVFQQDGYTLHITRALRSDLNGRFPNSWIGRHSPTGWHSRSLDLISCDLFLNGFVKGQIYRTSLPRMTHLKTMNKDSNPSCQSGNY